MRRMILDVIGLGLFVYGAVMFSSFLFLVFLAWGGVTEAELQGFFALTKSFWMWVVKTVYLSGICLIVGLLIWQRRLIFQVRANWA